MNDAVASGAYIIAHPSVEFIYRFYIKWRFIWRVWKPRIFTEYFDNNLKLNTYKSPGAYASGFLYVHRVRRQMGYITRFGLTDSASYFVGGIKIGRSGAL